jgi:hypothetical protein
MRTSVRRARKRPPYAPPARSDRLYLRLPPRDVAFFKFVMEGHDNLALLTVVDRFASVVRMLFSPGQRSEVDAFLESVRADIPDLEIRFDPRRGL